MAGGGFGSLDSMIKSIKNNANLLRRKSMFQVIKEGGDFKKKKPYEYKKASKEELEGIRYNVIESNKKASIKRTIIFTLTALIISFAGYFMFAGHYSIKEYVPNEEYYKIETQSLDDNSATRTIYFSAASKACEENLKFDKRHGKSLSWYPSGELFRTANYRSGALMSEIYYYPSGGEIENFNERFDGEYKQVEIKDKMIEYSFYVHDGVIINNTFESEKID
ncbi:MAG: hypothetical protein RLO81_07110 [Fulvivirga sp.]|uniref:hypothetical protein n=1 Tax=Fulvivirga sp. TaxID=1931237 RepID=UPI0032EB74DD